MESFQAALRRRGFSYHFVSWEDAARSKGSCMGPNITNVTLCGRNCALHPMVRRPNFEDWSSDIDMSTIRVNYEGGLTTLRALLQNQGLLKPAETYGLMQVQSCIVPKSPDGATEFCPALYNFQSNDDAPAVLVLVITSMGVTFHVPGSRTEPLLMNDNGVLAWYRAEALGDIRGTGPVKAAQMSTKEQRDNYLFIVQVPLKPRPAPKPPTLRRGAPPSEAELIAAAAGALRMQMSTDGAATQPPTFPFFSVPPSAGGKSIPVRPATTRDAAPPRGATDMAHLTVGTSVGRKYEKPAGPLVRDERFPVRVTVCSYRLVEGVPNEDDAEDIDAQLTELEKMGINHGSLVTNAARPTEPILSRPREDPSAKADAVWGDAGLFA